MTKKQYMSVRLLSKEHNANIYPTYKDILQTKEQRYPSEIIVSEKCAEVELQSLIDHTITRGTSMDAWIRSLECLLNIAYRMDIKSWQVQKKDKEIVEQRKKYIQEKLKQDLGLLVDIPKPESGTTNDGNSARIFFNNPPAIVAIAGIEQNIIEGFAVILKTIASGFAVNIEAFEAHTTRIVELYVSHYNWYYMPVTVHKLLIHGSTIIQCAILPIRMLSEEASNKDLRNYRQHNARKFSRKQTLEDVIHFLLICRIRLLEDPSFLIYTVDSTSDENGDSNVNSDDD
ncbi:hypothetical protein ILUMI_26481 [Ignelater luminosus]|uniref:Uncharacterized protein n=1 Tax=Ignelater luminosus TaxID=2038154 RepID=A0A8K0C6F9_IGNLU|nr:hypothetical protein ILUMI_26481 [Ignelater luminosus]